MAPTLDAALSLPATALGVRAARSAVDAAVRRLSRDDDLLRDVRLCVSEAVTNVVRHAYDTRGDESVEVTVQHERNEVTVTVRDRGRGLTADRPSDTGGYRLEIIDELTARHVIRTSSGDGTELAMVFDLRRPRHARSVARVRRAAARA
jgi:anti-sigma regulatory factor (Ser/Thr protein kinase)